jgi:hypothetical protein
MYNKIPNGSTVEIQGLKINLPPLGFGVHAETGDIAKVEIIKRSTKPKEQYWEAPYTTDDISDWNEWDAEERERKLIDDDYTHNELLKVKQREWHRRMYGIWVYINGTPTYITGSHYFYLTYWRALDTDSGLPDYRLIDTEYFYFWQYIVFDPKCYGMIEIRKRRDGKSYRAACITYETISRSKKEHGGIQSKNKDDAADFFQVKMIPAWQTLPSFFRPEYDTASGDTPTEALRFFRTSKKGKGAKVVEAKKVPALQSSITFKDRQAKAYDGRRLKRLVLDESGKVEINVMDRHTVVKYCMMDNRRRIVGKMIVTSTVEEIGVRFGFKKLWEQSNQYAREKNGTTKSGLYKFFIPASRSGNYDKFGVPDEEGTLTAIKSDREALADDPDELNGIIRKEPLSEKEAFMISSGQCHFNSVALNNRIGDLSIMDNATERGDFLWKNGERYTEVEWVKNKTGSFEICHWPEEPNKIKDGYHGKLPQNTNKYICGVDPIDIDLPKDEGRASKPAAIIMKRSDVFDQQNPYNKAFVCKYLPKRRAKAASEFYEDLIKMVFFYGCQLLHENNKNRLQYYFEDKKLNDFLIRLPGEKEFGINANTETKAAMLELTKEYVKENVDNVWFTDLLEDWLEFDIKESTPYDLAMAAGWCIVADKYKMIKKNITELKDITQFFPLHKIA